MFGPLPFQDVMHYEQLKAGVIQHELLVDNLIYKVCYSTLSHCMFIKLHSQDVLILNAFVFFVFL